MFLFFAIVGMVVVAVVAGFVLITAYCAGKEWVQNKETERFYKLLSDEVRLFAHRLDVDAHWFSEDVPTMNLLRNLAKAMGAGHGVMFSIGMDELRDRWRKDKEQQKTGDAKIHPVAARVVELEDVLSSAKCIADRQGKGTDWETFSRRIAGLGISGITPKVFMTPEAEDDQWAEDNYPAADISTKDVIQACNDADEECPVFEGRQEIDKQRIALGLRGARPSPDVCKSGTEHGNSESGGDDF